MKNSRRPFAFIVAALSVMACVYPRPSSGACISDLVSAVVDGEPVEAGEIRFVRSEAKAIVRRFLEVSLPKVGATPAEEKVFSRHDPDAYLMLGLTSRDAQAHRYIEERVRMVEARLEGGEGTERGAAHGVRGEARVRDFLFRLESEAAKLRVGALSSDLLRGLLCSSASKLCQWAPPVAAKLPIIEEWGAKAKEFELSFRELARGIYGFVDQIRWNLDTVDREWDTYGQIHGWGLEPHVLQNGEILWLSIRSSCGILELGFSLDTMNEQPQLLMVFSPRLKPVSAPSLVASHLFSRSSRSPALTSSPGSK